jgi:GT2 family glycosyltransferase
MISLDLSDEPIASIIILTRDNIDVLGRCLTSLATSIDPQRVPFEVILLFQEMDDSVVRSFLKSTRGLRPLRATLNLGFAAGNNFAARHAKGKYLVFLNDDTQAQPGWLEWLVNAARADPSVGAVGSRLLFPDGRLQEAGVVVWANGTCLPLGRGEPAGSLAYSYVRPVDYASANGLLLARDTFEAAGGFDERFFPGYYEDVDLCMTIRHRLGKNVVYEPRSLIVHEESVTMKRDPDFRDFLFRRHLALFVEKWGADLASYEPARPDSAAAVRHAVLARRGHPASVLIIDDRVPAPGMGSGFGRITDLFEDLRDAPVALSFHPSNQLHLRGANPLAGYGVDLVSEPLREHLAREDVAYDLVVISRPHNYKALYDVVREGQPRAKIVYDAEALYHRRLRLQAALESSPEIRERLQNEAAEMELLEAGIARSADRLVSISDDERQWLERVSGHAPIEFMIPFSHGITMTPANLAGRSGAAFVAGWLAGEESPNVGGLRWYVDEVAPRVRARFPDFKTVVTGARPPLSVELMAGDGIVLTGFVESLEAVYRQARVAIAPILAGAGVKIKTLEALQYGVPLVATTVGAEGLGLADGEQIDIADDPAAFAQKLIALLSEDALWEQRRQAIGERVARWQREQSRWASIVERVLAI